MNSSPSPPAAELWVARTVVAQALGVSEWRVGRLARDGRIRTRRPPGGGRVRYSLSDALELLDESRRADEGDA